MARANPSGSCRTWVDLARDQQRRSAVRPRARAAVRRGRGVPLWPQGGGRNSSGEFQSTSQQLTGQSYRLGWRSATARGGAAAGRGRGVFSSPRGTGAFLLCAARGCAWGWRAPASMSALAGAMTAGEACRARCHGCGRQRAPRHAAWGCSWRHATERRAHGRAGVRDRGAQGTPPALGAGSGHGAWRPVIVAPGRCGR